MSSWVHLPSPTAALRVIDMPSCAWLYGASGEPHAAQVLYPLGLLSAPGTRAAVLQGQQSTMKIPDTLPFPAGLSPPSLSIKAQAGLLRECMAAFLTLTFSPSASIIQH